MFLEMLMFLAPGTSQGRVKGPRAHGIFPGVCVRVASLCTCACMRACVAQYYVCMYVCIYVYEAQHMC